MKSLLKLILISMPLCLSFQVDAQNYYDSDEGAFCCEDGHNFYAEFLGGANFLQAESSGGIKSSFDAGYIVAGSFGYRWCYGLRVEAEYAFRRNDLTKIHFFGRSFSAHGHFQSSSYMANVLWDAPFCNWGCDLWNIQPFIGAGIGYDFQQIHAINEGLSFRKQKKGFAWQAIAGLKYPLFCDIDISLEYKCHQGGFSYIYNHSLGVGLTYNFG